MSSGNPRPLVTPPILPAGPVLTPLGRRLYTYYSSRLVQYFNR